MRHITPSGAADKYSKVIKESYIELTLTKDASLEKGILVKNNEKGTIDIKWDVEKGALLVSYKDVIRKITIYSGFGGFNHAGIVLPCEEGQEFTIRSFEEQSLKTGQIQG